METSTASSNNGWQIRTLKEMLEDGSMDASDLPDPSWLDKVELLSAEEAEALDRLGLEPRAWYVNFNHKHWPDSTESHRLSVHRKAGDRLRKPQHDDTILICWLVK